MSEGIKKRLSSENSQRAINRDVTQKVNLENKERLLPSGEINHILDVGEQFNKERQSSLNYRLMATIKPVFTNVLFNMAGSTLYGNAGWDVFNNSNFLLDPFDNPVTGRPAYTYEESYRKFLKEKNGWFGYYDPDVTNGRLCEFYDMEPKRERLLFGDEDNWGITVTYPYSADTGHTLVSGGLLIIGKEDVEISKRPMVALCTCSKHGLSSGDSVRLDALGGGLDGDYRVIRTGLDDGSNKEHYFVIEIKPSDLPAINQPRMKRLVSGNESTYYFRLFKKIMTTEGSELTDNDLELYDLKFASTIYDDPNYQLMINPDITTSGLTDNLGRPISELYYTFIKKPNGFFSAVKSGIESELINGILSNPELPDIRQIYNGGGNTPLESGVTISQDIFYGDIVEYNTYEVREKVLGEVSHRFNTLGRDGVNGTNAIGPRVEGYFYKAHHQIKIREYSNYVEQGDSSVAGIPDYAEDLGDGRFLWRDLLDIGFNDGQGETLDYPFLNGSHYMYNNIYIFLKRQDPFGQYGLYYGDTTPRDILGDSIVDTFKINSSENIC